MNTPARRPTARCYAACGALATAALVGIIYRTYVAVAKPEIGLMVNLITLTASILILIGAVWYGWLLRDRNRRAEIDALDQRVAELSGQVAALENHVWWGKPLDPEQTVELGPNVVPIRRPSGQAKGSAG